MLAISLVEPASITDRQFQKMKVGNGVQRNSVSQRNPPDTTGCLLERSIASFNLPVSDPSMMAGLVPSAQRCGLNYICLRRISTKVLSTISPDRINIPHSESVGMPTLMAIGSYPGPEGSLISPGFGLVSP